ncbi:MAG: hypothetical protein M9913_00655 [Bryobacteraceae bacterium]|nr:hypothetical protein [Solibacteraceae bacterium]MCO5349414.1 hypothetical protein [Bryobacteraceae bacterium]
MRRTGNFGRWTGVLVLLAGGWAFAEAEEPPEVVMIRPVMIAAANECSFALGEDGSVWAWGVTGLLPFRRERAPVRLGELPEFVAVEANCYHALAVKADGSLWAWGQGQSGQLGNGWNSARMSPVAVGPGPGPAAKVVAGELFSLALSEDGSVWSWGDNMVGQLGSGAQSGRNSPARVPGMTDVIDIDAGVRHSVAVKSDGTVWWWGFLTYTSPVAQVPGLSGIVKVAAGKLHNLALKNDGTVWAWGGGIWGELGNGAQGSTETAVQVTGLENITAIAAGAYFSVAVGSDGRVWAWGQNGYGQTGEAGPDKRLLPFPVPGLTDIVTVAAGESHVVALDGEGGLWAWGRNHQGQLGDGIISQWKAPPVRTIRLGAPDLVTSVGAGTRWGVGSTHAFAVTVENLGHSAANGTTTVQMQLPEGIRFDSYSGTGWTCTAPGGLVTCENPARMEAGASATVILRLQVGDAAYPWVRMVAWAMNPSDENLVNNTSAAPVDIAVPTVVTIEPFTPSPGRVGDPITVRYRVESSRGVPPGNVNIWAGFGSWESPVSAGEKWISTSQTGLLPIRVSYPGGPNALPSEATANHWILPGGTSPSSVELGQITPSPSVAGQVYNLPFRIGTGNVSTLIGGTLTVSDGEAINVCDLNTNPCPLVSTTAGLKTVTAVYSGDAARGPSGASRSHRVDAPAAAVSGVLGVTPASGEGVRQAFRAAYQSPAGHRHLQWVQMLLAAGPHDGWGPYCLVHYDVQGERFWLYSDVRGYFMGPVAPGVESTELQGSHCLLGTAASAVRGEGARLEVDFDLTFKAEAERKIYLRSMDLGGRDTGWVQQGVWGQRAERRLPFAAEPNQGMGAAAGFTLRFSDPPGVEGMKLGWVQLLMTRNYPPSAGDGFCFLHYDRAGNGLWMYSPDVGYFVGPERPGTAATVLDNSSCALDVEGTRAREEPRTLVVEPALIFRTPMRGTMRIFVRMMDGYGEDSNWTFMGYWTIP